MPEMRPGDEGTPGQAEEGEDKQAPVGGGGNDRGGGEGVGDGVGLRRGEPGVQARRREGGRPTNRTTAVRV